jgi:peroxiredoxin
MSLDTTADKNRTENTLLQDRRFWIALIALVVILGGAWIVFSQTLRNAGVARGNPITLEPAPVAGHPAPDFELKTLEGDTLRLSDLKGQPVILNFWATWCAPCRAEFPDFQRTFVDNADNLIIVGVNNTAADQESQIGDFVQEMGATFPIVLDETGDTVETYRILGLPTTIFIDRDGVINEVFTGPVNQAYIESKLPEL